MAICGNCGAEGPRIRSIWKDSVHLRDECPSCAPQSFEKFTAPSDKKIWMGYEAHPNEYVKAEDGGYDRKPEYRAEQEAKLALWDTDDALRQQEAEAKKRATRRTEPMDAIELQHALAKASIFAEALEESTKHELNQATQAELDTWVSHTKQA